MWAGSVRTCFPPSQNADDHLWTVALQGGFAGGEMGLQKFLKEGDIQIAGEDGNGQSQMSPVLVGIFVAAVVRLLTLSRSRTPVYPAGHDWRTTVDGYH